MVYKFIFLIIVALFQVQSAFSQNQMDKEMASGPQCEIYKGSIDYSCIETQLKGDGLGGWVHAAVKDQFIFVFTWRDPQNFFVNVQLPMSSKSPLIIDSLSKLKRHDRINIKGSFFHNDAPIRHINVSDIEVIEAYHGANDDYLYDPNLPDKIAQGNHLIGKVHAVADEGKVLVIETGDRVFPVFNKKPDLTKDLYRNDKIEIQYFIPFVPNKPMHIELDTELDKPLTVLNSIVSGHNEPIQLKGPLVMYPKSPQIIFNVYALRLEDSDGVKWDYTLVNFEDVDLFKKIREKLEEAWNKLDAEAKYDRNKYINPQILVEVSGIKNVVDPGQANPQVLINDINDLKITFLK
jgi:hypothetical protein